MNIVKSQAPIYHTDTILQKHKLLVKQVGWGNKSAKFSLVDWESLEPASPDRIEKYWNDECLHGVHSEL